MYPRDHYDGYPDGRLPYSGYPWGSNEVLGNLIDAGHLETGGAYAYPYPVPLSINHFGVGPGKASTPKTGTASTYLDDSDRKVISNESYFVNLMKRIR